MFAGLMSALGQKQTLKHVRSMSALPPKADIRQHGWDVRFVPKADIAQTVLVFRKLPSCICTAAALLTGKRIAASRVAALASTLAQTVLTG
jgi:hypothetical protein